MLSFFPFPAPPVFVCLESRVLGQKHSAFACGWRADKVHSLARASRDYYPSTSSKKDRIHVPLVRKEARTAWMTSNGLWRSFYTPAKDWPLELIETRSSDCYGSLQERQDGRYCQSYYRKSGLLRRLLRNVRTAHLDRQDGHPDRVNGDVGTLIRDRHDRHDVYDRSSRPSGRSRRLVKGQENAVGVSGRPSRASPPARLADYRDPATYYRLSFHPNSPCWSNHS